MSEWAAAQKAAAKVRVHAGYCEGAGCSQKLQDCIYIQFPNKTKVDLRVLCHRHAYAAVCDEGARISKRSAA